MSNVTQSNGSQPLFSGDTTRMVNETRAHAEQVCDFGNGITSILSAIPHAFNRLFEIVKDAEELRDVDKTAISGLDSTHVPNAYVRGRIAGMG